MTLQKWLTMHRMSQKAFADRCGPPVFQALISGILRGKARPSGRALKAILAVTGPELTSLTQEGPEARPTPAERVRAQLQRNRLVKPDLDRLLLENLKGVARARNALAFILDELRQARGR